MATENLDGIYSFPAAADYRTNQYQFVTINSAGRAVLAGAGTRPKGLLHNAPNAYTVAGAEPARVVSKAGVVVKVKLGGTVTVGGAMSCNSTGQGVISATSGHVIFGTFLEAGVSGDIVSALYEGYVGLVP